MKLIDTIYILFQLSDISDNNNIRIKSWHFQPEILPPLCGFHTSRVYRNMLLENLQGRPETDWLSKIHALKW